MGIQQLNNKVNVQIMPLNAHFIYLHLFAGIRTTLIEEISFKLLMHFGE